jgi:hypothetical protein
MTYYNTPTINDTGGFYEIFKFIANDTTGGLFFPVILLVVWVVAFMSTKGFSNSRAFTFASFFCSILSIMMGILDVINPRYMYLCFILTAIGIVWLKLDTN